MSERCHGRKAGALVGAGLLLLGWGVSSAFASFLVPQTPLNAQVVPKFVDPLPAPPKLDGTKSLKIDMSEFQAQILPAPFRATTVWGYNRTTPGPTIEAKRGVPTKVTYTNSLLNPVLQDFLTVDQTLHWADPLGLACMEKEIFPDTILCPNGPDLNDPCCRPYGVVPSPAPVPAVTHLHGAEVPSVFDGGPESWFTPGFKYVGPGFSTNVYTYPNGQEATTLWYHDHALGVTRLNVYGGLAGFYLLRDSIKEVADLPKGAYEREIIIQDRQFDTNGQLLFPDGFPSGFNGPPTNPTVHPFWSPEFFGDAIVVNGKTWPYLNVEPRRYRLRFLNGSNARFYTLGVQNLKGGGSPVFWQIGTDGGYLDKPVQLSQLTIAPGERADVIVDFGGLKGGQFLLKNSAKAPFPAGANPDPQTTAQVMKINVSLKLAGTDTSFNPAAAGANLRPSNPIVRLNPTAPSASAPLRRLTLNEVQGPGGPLEVILNNSKWMAATTETPKVGGTEIWEITNTTGDTHPIHIHLIQFQLLSRQKYQVTSYTSAYNAVFPGGTYVPASGPPLPYGDCRQAPYVCGGNIDPTPYLVDGPNGPDANEFGWKDTLRMNPGEVTRIAVRWAPLNTPVSGVSAGTNLYSFDPTVGPGYVWHCHILDHEDNEMMRPQMVIP